MFIFKIYYHVMALLKYGFLKIIYGKKLVIGKNTTWRRNFGVMIEDKGKIKIGGGCFFNHGCSLNSRLEIEIGEGTLFGENVKIYDHNHRFSRKDVPIKEQGYRTEKIEIGNHCWIGSNVIILKGTRIEDNCVIGAGSIINGEKIKQGSIIVPSIEYDVRNIKHEKGFNEM